MILYNIKTNKQRYYTGHKKQIKTFIYNKKKRLIISVGEGIL